MRNKFAWLTAGIGCAVLAMLFYLSLGGTTTFERAISVIAKQVQTAAVFFVPSITIGQIQNHYAPTKKVRILIVPGHQPDAGGTEFGGVEERDVVVDIADALADLLAHNPHYDVMVARTKTEWNPILQNYFDTHATDIETFTQSLSAQMKQYLADGSILPIADQVYHNSAPSDAMQELYGINKWTSDNGYDITLHLHINDYAGRRMSVASAYNGFAIYVPDHQYSNATASKAIGEAIAVRLNAYHATSTLPKEDVGVVEDQQLIAIGSNNSADDAALLIEYGYIYEPQFQESSVRQVAVADYAYQTYLGLQDFFKDSIVPTYGSISFPYDWTKVVAQKNEHDSGVYALQAALHYLGLYPSGGKSFSDCPISGVAGPCTRSAIMAYQRARGLDATGEVGPQTRTALEKDLAVRGII